MLLLRHCAGLALTLPLAAQTTWIVNPGGGPGVHFTELAPAVAAAADGDTILVQWGPFLTGVSGFSTSKGLTIVGEGRVFLNTQGTPVVIAGVPAGRQFRLAGFEAPRDQPLRISVQNCSGEVLLDNLHAVEPGPMPPSTASILVDRCALVTMRDVEAFGNPAVQIDHSTAVLVRCRLGITSLGLGGGPALQATDAVVSLSEPLLHTADGHACITAVRTELRIGGSSAASIVGGLPAFALPGTAIQTTLGSVTLDPAVVVQSTPLSTPPVLGSALVSVQFVPAGWCEQAAPGQVLTLHASQPANSTLLQFVGLPGPVAPTPFGSTLVLQAPFPVTLSAVVPSTVAQVVGTALPIPAALPPGLAFVAQTAVIDASGVELGIPVPFVVH